MKPNIRKIAVSGMLIALATGLSLIKIWTMPLGGSVTLLSMVPIVLLSVKFGAPWGIFSAFVYSLVQIGVDLGGMMGWGMDARMWVGALVFDYLLAYTVIGLAGIFRGRGTVGIVLGTALSMLLRFISHFISGCIFFGIWSPWGNIYLYSLCYNGAYMLPELIFTAVAVVLLCKSSSINRFFNS